MMRAYFESIGRGRAADEDRHPRHRPRHQPGERGDGRLRARRRSGPTRAATSTSTTSRAKVDEQHRRADAHEPLDARALRREHRGDPRHLPRRRRAHVLRRRQPERRLRHLAAGRHGLRHRPHQPAQDVLAAPRRRRPRRRPGRGAARGWPFLPVPVRRARRRALPPRPRPAARRSARCAASRAPSASSSAPTRSCAPGGPGCAR